MLINVLMQTFGLSFFVSSDVGPFFFFFIPSDFVYRTSNVFPNCHVHLKRPIKGMNI